jgi:hypothetical protein
MPTRGASAESRSIRGRRKAVVPSGAPIVNARVDVPGSNGSEDVTTRRAPASISAMGPASSRARAVGTTPFGVRRNRVTQEPAQSPEPVADRRGGKLQQRRGPTDMAFPQHCLEHNEEVQVGP